jgi:hypothetical protein
MSIERGKSRSIRGEGAEWRRRVGLRFKSLLVPLDREERAELAPPDEPRDYCCCLEPSEKPQGQ